jgi:hypothetical protein
VEELIPGWSSEPLAGEGVSSALDLEEEGPVGESGAEEARSIPLPGLPARGGREEEDDAAPEVAPTSPNEPGDAMGATRKHSVE